MKKIFVNGSFDLLHTGHIDLLWYAKNLGDHLLVAIDSDERIRKNKGNDRPFNPLHIRKMIIKNLRMVDAVAVFNTDNDLINIIRRFEPDIMVKGSDWKGGHIIGGDYCKEIRYYERVKDESTTKLIEDFITRRQLL
jgi:D-beta-D-heptose 7-phosphate kinase/D-beta-D-heptose 1-phosphate adenosyltransferase